MESEADSPHSWQERGEGSKVIAEAGMIMRDPTALHLIILQVDFCHIPTKTDLSALHIAIKGVSILSHQQRQPHSQ